MPKFVFPRRRQSRLLIEMIAVGIFLAAPVGVRAQEIPEAPITLPELAPAPAQPLPRAPTRIPDWRGWVSDLGGQLSTRVVSADDGSVVDRLFRSVIVFLARFLRALF